MSSLYLNGKRIRQGKQVKACCLNSLNQVRNNPLTTAGLESTAKGLPTGWLGIVELSPTEIRLDWAPPKSDGALEVHYSKNRTRCWFAGGTLIAQWPILAVEKGYVRQLKWRIDEMASGKIFVVSLGDQPVVPTKKPRKASAAAAKTEAKPSTKKASTSAGAAEAQ